MTPYHQSSPEADDNACDLSCFVQMNDAGMMKIIWDMFQKTVPDGLYQLKHAAVSKDWPNVRFISHKLKSSLGIIQIRSLLKNMSAIEISARDGNDLDSIFPLIDSSIKDYQEALPVVSKSVEAEIERLQN